MPQEFTRSLKAVMGHAGASEVWICLCGPFQKKSKGYRKKSNWRRALEAGRVYKAEYDAGVADPDICSS